MSRIYISMLTNPSLTNANHNWNQIDWKAFLSITCYCVQQGRHHTGRRLARPQSYLDLVEIYVRKLKPSPSNGLLLLQDSIAVYKIALLLTASSTIAVQKTQNLFYFLINCVELQFVPWTVFNWFINLTNNVLWMVLNVIKGFHFRLYGYNKSHQNNGNLL